MRNYKLYLVLACCFVFFFAGMQTISTASTSEDESGTHEMVVQDFAQFTSMSEETGGDKNKKRKKSNHNLNESDGYNANKADSRRNKLSSKQKKKTSKKQQKRNI